MSDKYDGLPSTAKASVALGLSVYFTGRACPHGHIAPRRVINRGCTECHANKCAQPHRTKVKSDWLKKNKQKAQSSSRAWKSRNRAKVLSINAARRAMGRVPVSEFEKFFMAEIYDLARLMTKITKSQWHVDHVVPLKHSKVCGLHVPSNLRVIPAKMNMAKKNNFELERVWL